MKATKKTKKAAKRKPSQRALLLASFEDLADTVRKLQSQVYGHQNRLTKVEGLIQLEKSASVMLANRIQKAALALDGRTE